MKATALIATAAGVSALAVGAAQASAPPVGPLPTAQVVQQTAQHSTLVALALPATQHGAVWRVARAFNGRVATEIEESTLKSSTVIVLRALAPGRTSITYALTASETSSRALRAITLDLQVR